MPTPEQLVQGLSHIANHFLLVAVAWHVVVLGFLAAIAWREWRPSRRTAVWLLALPMLSVGVLSWATGNPFNGTVFTLLAVSSLVLARRAPRTRVLPGPTWSVELGGAAVAFAWTYPHFLEHGARALYLVASPMGLIPCPTLSLVLGLGLIAGGFGSRAWLRIIGGAGLFYALFGMFRLRVWLDAGLLVASVTAVVTSFARGRGTELAPIDSEALS